MLSLGIYAVEIAIKYLASNDFKISIRYCIYSYIPKSIWKLVSV